MDFPPILRIAHEHMVEALQELHLTADTTLHEAAGQFAALLGAMLPPADAPAPQAPPPALPEPATSQGERQLLTMGFELEALRRALELAAGDVQAAISIMLER